MKAFGALAIVGLLCLVLITALGVVWTRHESRVLFVQLTNLQNQRDDLNVEYGRLELEQATWAEPRRINEEARSKLGMVTPAPQDIQLVSQ
jgi:cell division protein FtsL